MNEHNAPQVRDLASVGTRVSWGAICAGSILALALCLLFTTLGAAVGLTVNERVPATTTHFGSVAWSFVIVIAALFVGGMVTSLLTVREDKTEAVIHGILMWALLVGVLFLLGAAGIRSGFMTMTWQSSTGSSSSVREGVSLSLDKPDLNRAAGGTPEMNSSDSRITEHDETMKRLAWYTFAATWLSMLAAAAGAYTGAGPTFRIVTKLQNVVAVN